MAKTVHVKVDRAKLNHWLRTELPRVLAGKSPDPWGLGKACLAAAAWTAMGDVLENFTSKSQGGSGADGVPWRRVSPFTIANRVSRQRGLSGGGGSPGFLEDMSPENKKRRYREIYEEILAKLLRGGIHANEARKQAKALARGVVGYSAPKVTPREKGKQGIGASQEGLPILIDTRALIESVSQGNLTGSGLSTLYQPPDNQTIDFGPGSTWIRTQIYYGPYHEVHGRGKHGGFRPARPWMWGGKKLPKDWKSRWALAYKRKLQECLPAVILDLSRRGLV